MNLNTNTPAWDDGRWSPLPTLVGDLEADVCVVGLGGSGLAAIDALLAAGLRVVGVDARQVGGGAAGRNGGFLLAGLAKFHHEVRSKIGPELARDLYRATLDELARFREVTPNVVRITGSLRIAADDAELSDCQEHLQALHADGFEAHHYDGPDGRGLLIPSDGVFNPLVRARQLALMALDRGARLFERSPVLRFGSGIVWCESGTVRCGAVLVTVDGGLEHLVPELEGVVRTARLQMLATEPLERTIFTRPIYARWGYEYWQQLEDRRLVLGGYRDRGGEDEWTHVAVPTAPIQAALETLLREQLDLDARITHRWAASVGYTASGMPVANEVAPDRWVAGGYSGTGNIVGALCARAIVERMVSGRSATLDLIHKAQQNSVRSEGEKSS